MKVSTPYCRDFILRLEAMFAPKLSALHLFVNHILQNRRISLSGGVGGGRGWWGVGGRWQWLVGVGRGWS